MARRIHIAGLSSRARYSPTRRVETAPSGAGTSPSNPGVKVRLAGLQHEFTESEYMTIARNAARTAADQAMELDMAGLLEAAREFRGELADTETVADEPSEEIQEAPLDMEDVEIHPPTAEDVLAED